MFFSVITFVATVLLGLFVFLCTDNAGIGAIASIALVGAIVVHMLHRLHKALVPESEVVFPPYNRDDVETDMTPVSEEESYGVNDLDNSEK